ncbi:MAG: hypothetical protein AB1714_31865 [Acidobacteriota bacterium]
MSRLKAARKKVDLMGFSLHVWTRGENFESELLSLVEHGVQVRILIMGENNPHLESILNVEQIPSISTAAVREELRVAQRVFGRIGEEARRLRLAGSYDFRTLNRGLILCQLCRTDSRLTMVQYLFSEVASRTPLLEVIGDDAALYRVYMNEFESLWRLESPVSERGPHDLCTRPAIGTGIPTPSEPAGGASTAGDAAR